MIVYTEKYQLKKGAFADVFIDSMEMTALKLFKSYDHPDLNGTGKESIDKVITNNFRRLVFETENQAYINIQKSDLLKKFTPKFYGKKNIEKVNDYDADISNHYLLDCCYLIEYISGKENKLSQMRQNTSIINQLEKNISFSLHSVLEEFEKFGIKYLLDSSVIFNENQFKVIDFATKDSNEFQPIIDLQ
jgi:hypothetical protein